MFVVNEPMFDYRDPWAIPFEKRYHDLCSGSRHVAYFYERPDTSTFRYREYNMIQVLQALGADYGAGFFGDDDRDHWDRVIDVADVIVICRARYNAQLNHMITRARLQGKRVLFDVDDLVFDPQYTHLVMRTLDQNLEASENYDGWFAYFGRIGATLRLCDGAITTNDYLAKRINEFAGVPVSVVPNFLDEEQLGISDRIYGEKVASNFARNGNIDIGYFSGSPTHNRDFALAAKALASIMREDMRVRLLVVGFLDTKGELGEFQDRIGIYPLHDFINLQRLMSLVEINIVPLVNNTFTNCKSELKYFEAAAVGTLTIASPIHTYAEAIHNGRNGYLAGDAEWGAKIREMIDNLDRYPEMAATAREHALAGYAWYNQLPRIERALFGTSRVIDPVSVAAAAGAASLPESSKASNLPGPDQPMLHHV